MKKIYHLVHARVTKKVSDFINPVKENDMVILSDTLWIDVNRLADRGRSIIHNEYLNDTFNSEHSYDVDSLTKEQIMNGLIFMRRYNENSDSFWDTERIDNCIFIVEEKHIVTRLLANLCEKLKPGSIDGTIYGKEGS